jgi:hypothetical protein
MERLEIGQEGLSSMELLSYLINYVILKGYNFVIKFRSLYRF